jgi:regulator of vacuolar morphogenesis
MEPIHSLSIPKTATVSSGGLMGAPVVTYTILIKLSNATSYTVTKRYSEFDAMHAQLMKDIKAMERTPSSLNEPPFPLPPKSLWKPSDGVFVEERRRGLENYLTGILYSKDVRWRRTLAWLSFLHVPKDLIPSNWDQPEASVFHLVSTQVPSTAPPSYQDWMREYAKCLELLREVRGCINERDRHAGSSSGQGIAASQVSANNGKKMLETLNAYITRLDSSLKQEESRNSSEKSWVQSWVEDQKDFLKRGLFSSSSEDLAHDAKKSKTSSDTSSPSKAKAQGGPIGQGELLRRRDLLTNLCNERDHVRDQLNKPTADSSTSFAADRASLLKTSASSSSRRKFGVQETDETRPLNDKQVLQLQRDMMDQQDEALESLSSVIQRQKQIGLAINQELEYQNQMLGDLDDTLTRVQSNLKTGDKKLNRILKG